MKLTFQINLPAWILLIWAIPVLFGNLETWYDYQQVLLRALAVVVLIYLVGKGCCVVRTPQTGEEK